MLSATGAAPLSNMARDEMPVLCFCPSKARRLATGITAPRKFAHAKQSRRAVRQARDGRQIDDLGNIRRRQRVRLRAALENKGSVACRFQAIQMVSQRGDFLDRGSKVFRPSRLLPGGDGSLARGRACLFRRHRNLARAIQRFRHRAVNGGGAVGDGLVGIGQRVDIAFPLCPRP